MTKQEADARYGAIVYTTPQAIVRARHSEASTTVYIHHVVNGVEQLPLGYVLGDNIATLEVRK